MSTVELNPRESRHARERNPDLPPNHPVNALSPWRKFAALVALSFSGFLGQFTAAIILVAFPPMAADLKASIGDIANSVGFVLLGIAVGPLFWNPLSRTLGRRPVYLLGSLLFLPCCIWQALSKDYITFAISRVFAGLSIAFSQTVPPSTIADIFPPAVIGQKMSMYVVAIITAPAAAPFFCGLIVRSSWRNLFWFLLGLGGLQLALFFFFVPETQWIEGEDDTHTPATDKDIEHHETRVANGGRVGVAFYPWKRPGEFMRICLGPVSMLRYFVILVPSFYYGFAFSWIVGITVVTPQTLGAPPYAFAIIPLGCSFLAYGVGGLLGFWFGGLVGDKTVDYLARKQGTRQPEQRLWATLPVMPFMFVAMLIIGISLQKQLHWIGLLIGGALYFFTISIITGLIQTYVLECYLPQGMDSMAVFNFFRMLWGFAIPFFVWNWGVQHGWLACYITQGALTAGLGILLSLFLIWKGRGIRAAQHMPIWE
ncbi:MFS general substrate transporter [Cutaneotrichosporon oleaginosum]|uniref:MFS general substrate transporter n=1 Tax=Cutaneotrichosporon oleaginosum TaxID=879819 RepID=A0A0J0XS80_9TREE|nr:MFS general substrate transporter [Cutaneotrichosporon oleaginosum]KLT43933.1 MFS general substrate transporter [Cutaneotrichosporon oleaginosum]TXT04120.1 hypothetical protein COLE_07817 [Cutaneotrichosporon oleaginosum]